MTLLLKKLFISGSGLLSKRLVHLPCVLAHHILAKLNTCTCHVFFGHECAKTLKSFSVPVACAFELKNMQKVYQFTNYCHIFNQCYGSCFRMLCLSYKEKCQIKIFVSLITNNVADRISKETKHTTEFGLGAACVAKTVLNNTSRFL